MSFCAFLWTFWVASATVAAARECPSDFSADLCNKSNWSSVQECRVNAVDLSERECEQVSFMEYLRVHNTLGDVALEWRRNRTTDGVRVVFDNCQWKKAFLRISNYESGRFGACKMYSMGHNVHLPIERLWDGCLIPAAILADGAGIANTTALLVDVKLEKSYEVVARKLLFSHPHHWRHEAYFYYIDCSDNARLRLHLQPLKPVTEVGSFKVTVWQQRASVRRPIDAHVMPNALDMRPLSVDLATFNEEGAYWFEIAYINDQFPDGKGSEFVTPTMQIYRKGAPLVIGIVGASFIIPFILFLFYMLNRKIGEADPALTASKKILIIYKSMSATYNDLSLTLANLLRDLTSYDVVLDPTDVLSTKSGQQKWCSDNLLHTTHAIYICSPEATSPPELDEMTRTFLQNAAHCKGCEARQLMAVQFAPSSAGGALVSESGGGSAAVPDLFKDAPQFVLLRDLKVFLQNFDGFQGHPDRSRFYAQLLNQLEAWAAAQEAGLPLLVTPQIIITEQTDEEDANDDEEEEEADGATEGDGLL